MFDFGIKEFIVDAHFHHLGVIMPTRESKVGKTAGTESCTADKGFFPTIKLHNQHGDIQAV
jgi:hypothetical protein